MDYSACHTIVHPVQGGKFITLVLRILKDNYWTLLNNHRANSSNAKLITHFLLAPRTQIQMTKLVSSADMF
jgi:hypothetical protein